jgi:hypothetical protein
MEPPRRSSGIGRPLADTGGHETVPTRRTCVSVDAGLDASIATHILVANSKALDDRGRAAAQ